MRGERYLVKINGELKILGFNQYSRAINKGLDIYFISTLQSKKKKVKEPITKKKILDLFKANIEMIANKGKINCINNFKKVVISKI